MLRVRGVRTQHVLYLGSVLGYVSAERLSTFPRAWLDSAGMAADVDQGVRWSAVHAGSFHTLMAYTLTNYAPRPARFTTEDVVRPGERAPNAARTVDIGGDDAPSTGMLPSKVFGVGRNTHAQLGLGFASHEATRGMMCGTLTGPHGITHLVAGGNGFSFVVTAGADSSTVYGVGNDTLGALGLGEKVQQGRDAWDVVSTTQEPQLVLHPLPKPVPLAHAWRVTSIAAGMDHSLLLLENSAGQQHLLSTGLNTDGQLGLSTDAHTLPIQPLVGKAFARVPLPARVTHVVCGADSSFALTDESDVWAWGNSEYGQSLAGVHDRILQPTLVPNPLLEAYARCGLAQDPPPRIRKLVAGGSFSAVLDTNGRVWVAGYGPIPQSAAQTHATLQLVDALGADTVDLFCGLEYIVAVTQAENEAMPTLWMWGIPPPSVSTLPVRTPTRIPYTLPDGPAHIRVQDMACNKDHLIVVLTETPRADAEPLVWAECIPPIAL